MSLESSWPLVQPATRDWLVANNGDRLSAAVLDDLARVGGPLTAGTWWLQGDEQNGFFLTDDGIDWVETVANGEVPDPPPT